MTDDQKKVFKERLKKNRDNKLQEIKNEASAEDKKLVLEQAEDIALLKDQLMKKNVNMTSSFLHNSKVDQAGQSELDELKKKIEDLETVLSSVGSLPKKIARTRPWDSVGKPFHKDIFKTRDNHKGFEVGFVNESEVDDYLSDGYTIARGENYGEKEGVLKRKRMIAVEQPIAAAEEKRKIQHDFNLAQRTSSLQKTKEMSEDIQRKSGNKTELECSL